MKFTGADFRHRLLPIALSQAIGFACGVAGVKVATELVPPADYGAYGVFLTFVPLGIWVVHAGLIKFVARHWADSADRGALLREVLRASARKLPWLASATLAATFAMGTVEGPLPWLLLFASAMLVSIGLIAQTALQAERAHWTDLAISSAGSITRSFLPPLLYAVAGGTLLVLETGFLAHAAVFACASVYLLLRYRTGPGGRVAQLTPVYDGFLFVALSAAGWLLAGMNRWVVAAFFGVERAGYFTLAGNVALIATSMLSIIFVQYFQPELFAAASEEAAARRRLARRVDAIALAYWIVALMGVLALRAVAPWLIGPLIDERYRDALAMILGAGFFGVATMTGQFYHTLLLAGRREAACGRVDFTAFGVLAAGSVVSAFFGETWFLRWLLVSPLVPWLVNRPLALRAHYLPAR